MEGSSPAGSGGQSRRLAEGAGGQEYGTRNCRELREFLKRVNHYLRFVRDYTAVAKPLTVLTSPKVKWA